MTDREQAIEKIADRICSCCMGYAVTEGCRILEVKKPCKSALGYAENAYEDLKSLGYVQKAEDQSLPREIQDNIELTLVDGTVRQLLKASWVKVEKE